MYGTVADSRVGRGTTATTTGTAARESTTSREMSHMSYGLSTGLEENDNSDCCPKIFTQLSKGNKIFAIVITTIAIVAVIVFSILAANETHGSGAHNSTDNSTYPRGQCEFERDFTQWATDGGASCPTFGSTKACTSDSDCQLGVAADCVYGSPRLLLCSNSTKKCALRTWALPRSLEKPGSGICPVGDLCANTGAGGGASSSSSFESYSQHPVKCVEEQLCNSSSFTCKTLQNYTL